MIDVTLPMELEDGRTASFSHIDPYDSDIGVIVEGQASIGPRYFFSDGRHRYGELPNLRNVPPAPIGHNGGPPLDTPPPAPETLADAHAAFYGAEALNALSLPDDDAKRGEYPMADGLLDYFPNALAEVSKVSKIGNDQHNPGAPMNWARDKSTDHANKIMRHLVDRGRFDGRGVRHTARLAWRALAMLQTELEQEEGFPQSRRSTGQAPLQANA